MANTPNITKIKEETRQLGADVKHAAQEAGSAATEKAKEAASSVAEKAKNVASSVGHAAGNVATTVGHKAEQATSAVGSGMQSLGSTIREHAPQSGMLGSASSTVADTLEKSGRYLEEHGLSGIGHDLTNLIRRNPIPAVLIGIGLGFMLARATRS
jgi:hypothetical protein